MFPNVIFHMFFPHLQYNVREVVVLQLHQCCTNFHQIQSVCNAILIKPSQNDSTQILIRINFFLFVSIIFTFILERRSCHDNLVVIMTPDNFNGGNKNFLSHSRTETFRFLIGIVRIFQTAKFFRLFSFDWTKFGTHLTNTS